MERIPRRTRRADRIWEYMRDPADGPFGKAGIMATCLMKAEARWGTSQLKGDALKSNKFNAESHTKAFKPKRVSLSIRATAYADELVQTAKSIASPGRGILAIDESNATCGKRLASIGLDNNESNRQAYRQLLLTTPGLGEYISGAILFEETLYQSTTDGKKFVDCLREENIVPGIKVDKGLVPLPGSNNESWCQGLDGLASRSAKYYKQGACFAKWPSELAVKEAAWGLARYAAISQDNGLVPIVEPEILLDGDHSIDRTLQVAEKVWAEVFFYLLQNIVMFEGILLKPSMVLPGAEHKKKATPEQVAEYTLRMLKRRVPPAVPGIMFLSGGQSEVEATLNLNAMNQSPNPWHVSFSYARALQNTVLKTWKGLPENVEAAQKALLICAKANSLAQLGRYSAEGESEEAKKGMFELVDFSAIDRRHLAMVFKFSSQEEAEAIEVILGDSFRFQARRPRTDSDIASAFVSFCLLLHSDTTDVERVAIDQIYDVHRVGLHDQLVDFSPPDPFLWVEEIDELALGSGRDIRWLCGQYRDLLTFTQNFHPTLDQRFLPAVDVDAALFPVHSAVDHLNALKDRTSSTFHLLLQAANSHAGSSLG
ncbi:hypothetical protein KI387_022767 [Taxus chinensis]|uniref:Fructose-bisphosphate aldolase n=1 Tax=Taxus chinensis TaxID=29808 RepID=A0AA38G1M3_TAXCH|nr:hypothetical protein KI387_022767 [Taxus chinensis]